MTTVLESLNAALLHALQQDERVYLLGEDILDPYGGAFKVTRGLSTLFPSRVLTTPISEAAMLGLANGMALRGLRPVAEVMFGDFVTLMADQLINHAAKFRWMYNDQVRVPLTLRLPMGGRRGYGPTHSQSLEKIFLGVPGLRLVAPSAFHDPAALLEHAVLRDDDPVLFVEHKLLYPRPLQTAGSGDWPDWQASRSPGTYPTLIFRVPGGSAPRLTLAAYGYNAELALQTAQTLLYEQEIFSEVLVFSQLSPFEEPLSPLMESLRQTGRLLTVEEGSLSLGWGAEIGVRAAESLPGLHLRRAAALDLPIANAKSLEDEILPSPEKILALAGELL